MHSGNSRQVNYPSLLHQTYEEAILKNQGEIQHWKKIIEEYEAVEFHMSELPKTLTRDVMVPLSPRALIRGKIVHTNEIMVCLGQGYFVERSAVQAIEICKRRKKICTDMLQALEKERDLLIKRFEIPLEEEAFAQGKEIIEEYDEEEDVRWRIEHRRKEKEYRKKLAELKASEKTRVDDMESLWKRLDELELQEELEEELDRLHAYGSDDDDVSDDVSDEEEDDTGNDFSELGTAAIEYLPPIAENSITGKNGLIQRPTGHSIEESAPQPQVLKHRVSFADRQEDTLSNQDTAASTLRIEFKHSTHAPSNPEPVEGSPLQSPGDIYNHFKNQFQSQPKSILKKSSSSSETFLENNVLTAGSCLADDHKDDDPYDVHSTPLPHPVSNEVIERDVLAVENIVQPSVERPISKFKAARMHNKKL